MCFFSPGRIILIPLYSCPGAFVLLCLYVKANPSSTVLKSECMAGCTISYPNQTKERKTWHKTFNHPQQIGQVTRIRSNTHPHVLRSDHFRSCLNPEHQQISLSLCRVSFFFNLSAVVGRMRDCHSISLVKCPYRFCDNASCVMLESLC